MSSVEHFLDKSKMSQQSFLIILYFIYSFIDEYIFQLILTLQKQYKFQLNNYFIQQVFRNIFQFFFGYQPFISSKLFGNMLKFYELRLLMDFHEGFIVFRPNNNFTELLGRIHQLKKFHYQFRNQCRLMSKPMLLALILCLVLPGCNTFLNLFGLENFSPDVNNGQALPEATQANIPSFARIIRSIDGANNNRRNPNFGKASADMPRLTSTAYEDSEGTMINRGNPRELSNLIGSFSRGEEPKLNQFGLNMLFVIFGQFIDHDIDLISPSGTQSARIAVPRGDFSFDKNGDGGRQIEFTRSKFTLKNGARTFANDITSFIDGSQIYGSDETTLRQLREFQGGRLRLDNNLLTKDGSGAFLAGDTRTNENIGLTSILTVFVREHNRQCLLYSLKFPELTDELLFQLARNKVIGFIQKITFKEYLPLLLGQEAFDRFIGEYKGYDEKVDATINLEFATAAYRIGHPLLANSINVFDFFNKKIKSILMKDMFLSFQAIQRATDVDIVMNGMMRTQAKQRSCQLVDGLRNLLIQNPGIIQDLFSLNVQRGRDHGMPDYNNVRKILGLKEFRSFSELTKNNNTVAKLKRALGSIDSLDLWIGIISEDSLAGGNLGQVGAAIVGETFRRIRNGDRFWYQFAYPDEEIEEIEATTFRDIILRNTRLSLISQGFIIPEFVSPKKGSSSSSSTAPSGSNASNSAQQSNTNLKTANAPSVNQNINSIRSAILSGGKF